jgi:hypothetical protein
VLVAATHKGQNASFSGYACGALSCLITKRSNQFNGHCLTLELSPGGSGSMISNHLRQTFL